MHGTGRLLMAMRCPMFREMQVPLPIATINRLVIALNWRKRGLAHQLDLARIQQARDEGAACIAASASENTRIVALQSLGFKSTNSHGESPYVEALSLHGLILTLDIRTT